MFMLTTTPTSSASRPSMPISDETTNSPAVRSLLLLRRFPRGLQSLDGSHSLITDEERSEVESGHDRYRPDQVHDHAQPDQLRGADHRARELDALSDDADQYGRDVPTEHREQRGPQIREAPEEVAKALLTIDHVEIEERRSPDEHGYHDEERYDEERRCNKTRLPTNPIASQVGKLAQVRLHESDRHSPMSNSPGSPRRCKSSASCAFGGS